MIRCLLVALSLLPMVAFAATDLDSLLQEVKESQKLSAEANAARERQFLQRKSEQARLLREAQSQASKLEARSKELRAEFENNDKEIKDLKENLAERTGDLGQIFAVVRQASGDLQAILEDSMVSAQLPGREAFLGELSQSRDLPPITSLEQLWLQFQEEMTESGRAVRFSAPVVQPDGRSEPGEVLRLGVFTAVSDGEYLRYLRGTGRFQVLPRQPGYQHLRLAAALERPEENPVRAVIDPTRGTIFSLLIEKPSLLERVRQGGVVGYIIITLGVLGLLLALTQWIYLSVVARRVRQQLGTLDTPVDNNPLGRILAAAEGTDRHDPESVELVLDEAILKETPRLERGQSILKLLAAVAPLLGLLGTVTGMILTFQAITLFGTGDPKLMAGGISQALVTTVLGLVVAIPLLFIHSLVSSRSRSLIQVLDEQSAGLLASRLERERDGSVRA